MTNNDELKYSNFMKDFSWQEKAIDVFRSNLDKFYSATPGQFKQPYVVEVSPSGGKTIFSLKLFRELLIEGLIDRVVFVVPRENIKDGIIADTDKIDELPEKFRLLKCKNLRIDADIRSDYQGKLPNLHGIATTYQALPTMLKLIKMFSEDGERVLIIFDEAHHGRAGDALNDETAGIWAEAMESCRSFACAIVCMTGTPIRADNRPVQYFKYEEILDRRGAQVGWKVIPDYIFSYRDAVIAGIARKIICRSQDVKITYLDDDGEEQEGLISEIPGHILHRVKNTAFDLKSPAVDQLLRVAYEECERFRAAGDTDAAILVIARRDLDRHEAKNILALKKRIYELVGETAVTVQSGDQQDARTIILNFKKAFDRWIVTKEMITEGANIPRIRVIVILRDIGNETFYRQLVHRATRNDADDHLQDAIIVQAQLPNLHRWGKALEYEAELAIKPWRPPPPPRECICEWQLPVCNGQNDVCRRQPPGPDIIGLFAELKTEEVVIEGEDFSEVDPLARMIYAKVGARSRTSRSQINLHLKAMQGLGIDLKISTVEQPVSIDEQVKHLIKKGNANCNQAAMINGGGAERFQTIFAEAKRKAGFRCAPSNLIREHPDALEKAKKFVIESAKILQRTLQQSKREDEI